MTINEFSNVISWHIYKEDMDKAACTIEFICTLSTKDAKRIAILSFNKWLRQRELNLTTPDVGIIVYYLIRNGCNTRKYIHNIKMCNFKGNFEKL